MTDYAYSYTAPTTGSIGSPRSMMSPRSRRSHRPRQRQDDYRYHTSPNYNNDPNDIHHARSEESDDVPENLHFDQEGPTAINVDPGAPVLAGAGGESIRDAEVAEEQKREIARERGGDNNFVGGFVTAAVKRAFSKSRGRRRAGVDGDGDGDLEAGYGVVDEDRSPSSSETMYEYPEPDDGTTAVDHQPQVVVPMPNPGHYVTPVIAEPQLAPDYAKMDSPYGLTGSSESDSSGADGDNTYMSRLAKFFKHLNDLPWVAESRVTVDYYPGQAKRRGRSRPGHGKRILSWYNRHAFPALNNTNRNSLDLNASPSPKPEPLAMAQYQTFQAVMPARGVGSANQPLILPTVPISPEQVDPARAFYAEPISATTTTPPPFPLAPPTPSLSPLPPPPPISIPPVARSAGGHSARTTRTAGGRSIVYSVVNPSAPSSSSSSAVTSPLTKTPRTRNHAMAMDMTGYTPSQPLEGSFYGRAIHPGEEPPAVYPYPTTGGQP
ncbi:hypothetical protein BT96DRAFT_83118 [Gymnopus androsaceus JB14]|uniref:Uncharacterized protein n=1 Tax=Gymnopus androsaceus JB14 TaxID=1447944 RepID=A0A6A4IF71_9AGAR|nr:hypothetical protein BT96DRAFT_83118 [Gymnopus androsaceus JB14]